METLSEQIRNRYFEDTNKTEGYFMSKDVKEFIKELKKKSEFKKVIGVDYTKETGKDSELYISWTELIENIDKLAGDKLI